MCHFESLKWNGRVRNLLYWYWARETLYRRFLSSLCSARNDHFLWMIRGIELFFFSWLFSELHRERVHTVSSIERSESLPMEYVTEVSATVRAGDLRTPPIGIDGLEDSTLDRGIKWRPPTSRVEFEFASIEIESALTAGVDTIFEGIGILSDEGHLCTLSDDDTGLLRSKGIIFLHSV